MATEKSTSLPSVSNTVERLGPSSMDSELAKTLIEATHHVLRRRFRLVVLVRDAYARMQSRAAPLQAVWTDLRTSLRLLVAWLKRSYRQISMGSLVVLVAALVYFVTPVDIIPDTLGALGFVDDVGVISTAVETLRSELDRFREWEERKGLSS